MIIRILLPMAIFCLPSFAFSETKIKSFKFSKLDREPAAARQEIGSDQVSQTVLVVTNDFQNTVVVGKKASYRIACDAVGGGRANIIVYPYLMASNLADQAGKDRLNINLKSYSASSGQFGKSFEDCAAAVGALESASFNNPIDIKLNKDSFSFEPANIR